MNLQQVFFAIFIAGCFVGLGAGLVVTYQRLTGRKYRLAALFFLYCWIVTAADGLLAWALGYR